MTQQPEWKEQLNSLKHFEVLVRHPLETSDKLCVDLPSVEAFIETLLEKVIEDIPSCIKPYILDHTLEQHLKLKLRSKYLTKKDL